MLPNRKKSAATPRNSIPVEKNTPNTINIKYHQHKRSAILELTAKRNRRVAAIKTQHFQHFNAPGSDKTAKWRLL